MITLPVPQPSNCYECPMARPLYNDRFACGNSLTKVVKGHYPATAECHDAVLNRPDKYFQPEILPDLQGLDPELVCNHIHLLLNWLDVYPDEAPIRDGEVIIEVTHQQMTSSIKRQGDVYYCERISGLESPDPYWLALHMIHPDYLYQIVDEIIDQRASIPKYI